MFKKIFIASSLLIASAFLSTEAFAEQPSQEILELREKSQAVYDLRLKEIKVLRSFQLEYFLFVTDKEQITTDLQAKQAELAAAQKKLVAQVNATAELAQQINAYKAKNKNISKGTKAQKEKYRKQLESYQSKYKAAQTKTTAMKKQVATLKTAYQNAKPALTAINAEIKKVTTASNTQEKYLTQLAAQRQEIASQLYKMESASLLDERYPKPQEKVDTTGYSIQAATLTNQEKQLAAFINNARREKGLAALPISKSLTTVARTHIVDANTYHPGMKFVNFYGYTVPYSWSENGKWSAVNYFNSHSYDGNASYKFMFNKPSELTAYKNKAVEIYAFAHHITPELAFESFQTAGGDDRLYSGEGYYKNVSSMGVGIYGSYAYVWFGFDKDPAGYFQ